MLDKSQKEVKEHIFDNFPKEICGLFISDKKRIQYLPCTNVSEDDNEFIIDNIEYVKARLTSNVVAVVHSHNGPCAPSEWDIAQCNLHKLPFVIYGTDGIHVEYPKKHSLKGRIYNFGTLDCFEAVRDWYITKGVSIPPRLLWEDNWYDKGLDYITDQFKEWNLTEVKDNSIKYGDILIFKVLAPFPDHLGVYEGNDNFFHHAQGRISCSENLWDFWGEHIQKVLRHNEACNLRR